ncbi:solute carrier family 45, member 1/2/4 [Marchantia polymorpha subsp. ruderalis]|uniref:Sucrose transport protein SUC3 n=4 Tax=Marchantia polymorpha TaxID=3197 RepID=A0A176VLV6_MARPO|nr:hypothetical protein AXG93_3658s1150 [Marchantia polymorpha subsp. ruderalis]PTQ40939.1 hypothetical protein MARPO_0037s0109 [Marchantia polymorpha]BBN05164.1 hypothetical protein Mp_3g10870 [Marchantia polymorpha subsp. ruderalis]|eukprot:PTQ40939.1 hypothetical protein MARPO_0037s0109 [Marchantia polymorpha]
MELQERDGPLPKKQQSGIIELATIVATEHIDDEDRPGLRESDDDQVGASEPSEGVDLQPKLPLITLALSSMIAAGIQFGWALQLSLLTPYIQTLGIEHAFASFIWLCGPITGLLAQPCIGIWSDQCKSKWGRRRPFILTGALMVACSVIIIGFSADIGYVLGDSHESCESYKGLRPRAAAVFILGFWLLDLANNTVQGPARALLADLAGSGQREAANSIFVLWMAFGNILGFSAGASGQWSKWFPFLTSKACCEACGNLKGAFLLAVVFLLLCTIVTVVFSKETPLALIKNVAEEKKHGEDAASLLLQPDDSRLVMVNGELQQVSNRTYDIGAHAERSFAMSHKDENNVGSRVGPGTVMMNLLMGVRRLPTSMKTVLLVMSLCWLSWFPFFLFDTDWMGREVYRGDPKGDALEVRNYDEGVRAGAFGLLLNSVVLAMSSLVITPLCQYFGSKHVWALSNYVMFICMVCTTVITAVAVKLRYEEGEAVHIYTGWVKIAATALFTVLGFPLAITYSVPYSLTADLTADSGGGQGLAMGILNLAVVIPQMVVALGAGPWDELFGGGNMPAFALAGVFALVAGVIATKRLPRLSRHGYQRAVTHGFG